MLHRLCIACGLIFITVSAASAGNPTPQSNLWRKIGFGHGPGYHAYNACPPCTAAPALHGRGGTNYYGGYYVPGAYPGPQAGWFNHSGGSQTWSDSMVDGGPLSPVAAPGESIIISDDPASTAADDESIPTPAPSAAPKKNPAAAPLPAKLPPAPKAKQPPVRPAPDKDESPAGDLPAAKPKDAAQQLHDLSPEEALLQESSLPVEVEGEGEDVVEFPNDEPAGGLLLE